MGSKSGHAPTNGAGNKLYRLGFLDRGHCPDCAIGDDQLVDLAPAGESSKHCPRCSGTFPVPGGLP